MEIAHQVASALENQKLLEIKANFKMTPVFEFWKTVKDESNTKYGLNNIVLFQVGNFYETYFEDAYVYSKIVNETLTSKSKKNEYAAPMSGSPKFVVDKKVDILVKAGFTVVVVSEVEKTSKGSERKITDVHTPGTYFDKSKGSSNYVAYFDIQVGKAAIIDVYTSECLLINTPTSTDIRNIIETYSVLDVLSSDGSFGLKFRNLSITSNFLKERNVIIFDKSFENALSNCLSYCETVKETKIFLKNPELVGKNAYRFQLGQDALKNLEILSHVGGNKFSLLGFMDKTATPMGSRLLKKNLIQPFKDKEAIEAILNDVNKEIPISIETSTKLSECYDIERLSSKMVFKGFTPGDLKNLSNSLSTIDYVSTWALKSSFFKLKNHTIILSAKERTELENFKEKIDEALLELPSNSPYDGYVFKSGYNKELDGLRNLIENKETVFKESFDKIKSELIDYDFIDKMKLFYNKSGVFLELKRTAISAESTRKLAEKLVYCPPTKNFYRFTTPELENTFEKSLVAEEKRGAMEALLFENLRLNSLTKIGVLKKFAQMVAYVDYVSNLAKIAKENGYLKPEITDYHEFTALSLRHPVVEKITHNFTANDVYLKEQKLKVLTGPNMGGKSVYLKSIGITTLLAHIGSFVPAKFARLGIVDGIFVRAGSADDFSKNQSTFYLEMSEVAEMLKNCTNKSLLLVDELGRGTDTADGTAISKAVIKKILEIGPLCLFSTHYHSLTTFVKEFNGAGNCHVSVKVTPEGKLEFTHNVKEGMPDQGKSYGIEIAEAAGFPIDVIESAKNFKTIAE